MRKVKFEKDERHNYQFPSNALDNAKYSVLSFVPVVLFNQFKYFFNLFFLLVALSQIIESLRVGFLVSYVAPLVFVIIITMMKELWDDLKRRNRDKELNELVYEKLDLHSGRIYQV